MSKKPIIGLISLGCAKNLVDSEVMLGLLAKSGYKINLNENEADIIIVNTCSFINDAEKESVKAIISLAESGKKFIIAGCLAQKHKDEIKEVIPEALAFIGTGDIGKIVEIVNKLTNQEKNSAYEISDNPVYLQTPDTDRFQITVGSSSYIKIAEGCNYSCAFCIIPSLRGSYRSRPIESIVKEAQEFGKKGLSEVILIAQDTTSYGKDLYGKPSLTTLMEKLNDIEDISWIRIMYAFPSLINDSFIKALSKLDKIVKYIDIPLQHSHPDVLKSMNRPVMDNSIIINKLRDAIPDIAIRTAFITGFPGEEEQHFEHLYKFIEQHRFDKLGIFEYSREKNTGSYELKNQVKSNIKKTRKKELMKLQQGISREINQSLIGKDIPVLIESLTSSGDIIGRSYRDAPDIDGLVYIKSEKAVTPGDIISANITDADEYDLYARF